MPEGFPDADDLAGPEVVDIVEQPALWDLGDCPSGEAVLPELETYDGAQLDYRADEASVFIAVQDLGDPVTGSDVLTDVAASISSCSSTTDVVVATPERREEVAAAADVPPEDVVTLEATTSGSPGAAPFQAYERAVLVLDDGRLVVVTTVHSPAAAAHDIVVATAAAVDAARQVDGVPDTEGMTG